MERPKLLKNARDLLLKLHKSLLDLEREMYEGIHGRVTPGEFLNLLLEDEDFAWLREFSTLIVEIDELFASREGQSHELVEAHLVKVRDLVEMKVRNDYFKAKYLFALQRDPDSAGLHSQLKGLLHE